MFESCSARLGEPFAEKGAGDDLDSDRPEIPTTVAATGGTIACGDSEQLGIGG